MSVTEDNSQQIESGAAQSGKSVLKMHTRRTKCTGSRVSEEINDGDTAPTYNDNILCRHMGEGLEAGGWP